jgi:hypothetical protein
MAEEGAVVVVTAEVVSVPEEVETDVPAVVSDDPAVVAELAAVVADDTVDVLGTAAPVVVDDSSAPPDSEISST